MAHENGLVTVADALADHYKQCGIPPDGGDSEAFTVVRLGPIPFPIPNTKARKRAVRLHDLNHLVTGYRTNTFGEIEISSWELGSGGCHTYFAAWALDLMGLFGGMLMIPWRALRAFRAGRQAQNLYRFPHEELMALQMADLVERTTIRESRGDHRMPTAALLAVLLIAALPASALYVVVWSVSIPVWLVGTIIGRVRHS